MSVKEFREIIQLLIDGEDVASEVINRPLRQLGGNLKYLFEMIELAAEGSVVLARIQNIDPKAKIGQTVYYDASRKRWARARAAARIDQFGVVTVAETAQVWGIIFKKLTNDKADILLLGSTEVDLTEAIDGPIVSGQYYLSATDPGKLVADPPPISIPVLKVGPLGKHTGTYRVFVDPNFHDLVGSHEHHKFELVMQPAGVANIIDDEWVITSPDADQEGWLPADHAIFNGNAPAGAMFGYNLSVSQLGMLWPPTPLNDAYGVWDTGLSTVELGCGNSNEICKVTDTGIWWMSNCLGEVPWPLPPP